MKPIFDTTGFKFELIVGKNTDGLIGLIIFFIYEYLTKKKTIFNYKSYNELQEELFNKGVKMDIETTEKNLGELLVECYLKISKKNSFRFTQLIKEININIKDGSLVIELYEGFFNERTLGELINYLEKKG